MPNPDALQEFTIQSSNYSAEYGGAGALVQLSTRSGSNEIHGTAFEFLRNTDLNARNFFNIKKPPFKLNQFGGTVGGPIKKNKTFFFFAAQDTQRRSAPSPVSIITPSAAERQGNFSALPGTIVNPTTGQPFAGKIIPTSMFNPISVSIANALRAAYGIFYSFPEGLLYQRTDATQLTDLYLSIPAPQSFTNPYLGYAGGTPFPRGHIEPSGFSSCQFLTPVSGGMLDPASRVGYTQNWNFTLERQLTGDTALSVAYVGNHALNIMGSRQFNPAIFGPGATVANENSHRLYPGLGAVELASSYVYAEFNSLQINLTKRASKSLTLLANFTYGKTIDDTSSATEGNAGPPNPFNFASARGPADFDQEYRFVASAVYSLPRFSVKGLRSVLFNDWQLNAIGIIYSGLPFTVISGTDRSRSGSGNDYADLGREPSGSGGSESSARVFQCGRFCSGRYRDLRQCREKQPARPGVLRRGCCHIQEFFIHRAMAVAVSCGGLQSGEPGEFPESELDGFCRRNVWKDHGRERSACAAIRAETLLLKRPGRKGPDVLASG
jgi:hypothetical protein